MQSRRVVSAETDNTLRDLYVSLYASQSSSLIANYACGFNQSETGKYFERMIKNVTSS